MQKNLLAVAVAAALAAPSVAMAQSSVTISGALNLWVESAGATGSTAPATATATTFDVKSRTRMQDGAGSNIRFTAVEDLGGGIAGFGQVESAVFNNADTRATNLGTAGAVGGWGTRNSGVGLRGSAWGEILLGAIYDRSKWEAIGNTTAALSSELKRDVWSVPLSYAIGPHTVFGTFAKANKLKGNIGGTDISNITVTPVGGVGQNMGSSTGAKFFSAGYQFALSKRTNVHVAYSQIKNDALAGYDFFSNTVGMANGNYGSDPKSINLGVRHTF
jgi:predicted porin